MTAGSTLAVIGSSVPQNIPVKPIYIYQIKKEHKHVYNVVVRFKTAEFNPIFQLFSHFVCKWLKQNKQKFMQAKVVSPNWLVLSEQLFKAPKYDIQNDIKHQNLGARGSSRGRACTQRTKTWSLPSGPGSSLGPLLHVTPDPFS